MSRNQNNANGRNTELVLSAGWPFMSIFAQVGHERALREAGVRMDSGGVSCGSLSAGAFQHGISGLDNGGSGNRRDRRRRDKRS